MQNSFIPGFWGNEPANPRERENLCISEHTAIGFLDDQKHTNLAGGVYIIFLEYCNNRGADLRKCLISLRFILFPVLE